MHRNIYAYAFVFVHLYWILYANSVYMHMFIHRFGYLWSVHSLYYWWRDQGLAEQGSFESELSPCYLNRMDVTEIAVG